MTRVFLFSSREVFGYDNQTFVSYIACTSRGLFFCRLFFFRGDGAIDVSFSHRLELFFPIFLGSAWPRNRGGFVGGFLHGIVGLVGGSFLTSSSSEIWR